MPKFTKVTKTQIIILIVVLIIIFGGIIIWTVFQKDKILPGEEVTPEEIITEEIFSFSGIVSEVNTEANFLMVKPTGQENKVKVIITEETKLFEVLYPSEKEDSEFTTERREITVEEIEEEDCVFIKTNINIAGKKEFNNIDYIEVLPKFN